jgi:hypothetical protein
LESICTTFESRLFWRKVKAETCIEHSLVVEAIIHWGVLCEVKSDLLSAIAKPLVRRIVLEPHGDVAHEIDAQDVPWGAVPFEDIGVLRTGDGDVPVTRVPFRKHCDCCVELEAYQTLSSVRVNDSFVDGRRSKSVAEGRLIDTSPASLYIGAVGCTSIAIVFIVIITDFRSLDLSIATSSPTHICCHIVASKAFPTQLNKARVTASIIIDEVSIVTGIESKVEAISTSLSAHIKSSEASSHAGVAILNKAGARASISIHKVPIIALHVVSSPIPASLHTNCRREGRPRQAIESRLILAILRAPILPIYVPIITVIVPKQLSISTALRTHCSSIMEPVIRIITWEALERVGAWASEAMRVALFAVIVPCIRFLALSVTRVIVVMVAERAVLALLMMECVAVRVLPHSMPHTNR